MSTPVALIVTPNRDPQITAIPVPLRLADGHDLGKVCVPHTDSTYEPIASALEDLGRTFLLGAEWPSLRAVTYHQQTDGNLQQTGERLRSASGRGGEAGVFEERVGWVVWGLSPLTGSFPGDIVHKRGDCREFDQWGVLRIFESDMFRGWIRYSTHRKGIGNVQIVGGL